MGWTFGTRGWEDKCMPGDGRNIHEKQKRGRSSCKYENVIEMELQNRISWCGVEETFCIHYMSEISWVGEQLLASQECFAACV